jgi:hypothetical protein
MYNLTVRPFESIGVHRMHLVNEATILTTIYYAFLWTDLIESAEKRYFIAWTLIGLMGI